MRMRKLLKLLPVMTAVVSLTSVAADVSVKSGNIYFTDSAGVAKQLTTSGRDSNPVLAADGRWIAFIRKVEGKKIATGADEVDPSALWQIRTDGKESTLLVRCRASENKIESLIAGFEKLQFSSNGKLIYFITPAWATSGAVHVVDTTNRKEHFVCAGSDLKVVPSGEYKDCILIQQHRYFIGGGSYDWYWLFRPDGTEVGPVGEDIQNFESAYLKN